MLSRAAARVTSGVGGVWSGGLWRAASTAAGGGRGYDSLVLGVPKESQAGERRVAVTPEGVKALKSKGIKTVLVEAGAGDAAKYSDSAYAAAGATIVNRAAVFGADAVLKVRPPGGVPRGKDDFVPAAGVGFPADDEFGLLREKGTLISLVHPGQNKSLVAALATKHMDVLALDCIPRISRAQVFDVLSSQAGIAGNRAVVEAAAVLPRFFSGSISAAGRVGPAKVLVIGGGVAGLAAVGAARAMGAVVRCFDTRPEVREQVASQGGQFLELPPEFVEEMNRAAAGGGGYAKAMSDKFLLAEQELFAKQCEEVDVVISTALVPGRRAPLLVTKEAVGRLKPGSVTVDLAAENGGNIETTVPNEVVRTAHGVTCLGYTDLPSRAPALSSSLFSNNVTKFFLSLTPGAKAQGRFGLNLEDEVTRGALVLHGGQLMWPAPLPKAMQSVEKAAKATVVGGKHTKDHVFTAEEKQEMVRKETLRNAVTMAGGVGGLMLLGGISPDPAFAHMLSVAALAGVAGIQVVTRAQHALHSPLLSVTNMVSGLSVVGALSLMGGSVVPSTVAESFAAVAAALSAVNIVGGFLVTQRMLEMFRRKGDPVEPSHYYALPLVTALGSYGVLSAAGLTGAGVGLGEAALLAAGLASIGGIGGLASQETARVGNALAILGVGAGTLAALAASPVIATGGGLAQAALLLGAGGAAGYSIAGRVSPTELPQTVAAFHSLVGVAATATSIASFLHHADPATFDAIHRVMSFFGTWVGAITASGSVIAFGKLHGLKGRIFQGSPFTFPGQHSANTAMAILSLASMGYFVASGADLSTASGMAALLTGAGLAGTLGVTVGAGIGGADAPVFISMLNASSGVALLAEGFLLDSTLLTISGALIASSGSFLTAHMCTSMNRSIKDVVIPPASFGQASTGPKAETREHREATPDQIAGLLVDARSVVIVPGYGMAVAGAQTPVAAMYNLLKNKGVSVKFAVHPVAGRLPGQLNVLLAEAGVQYDDMVELDEGNELLEASDVCLVVGALDTTNRAAEEDPTSSIAGMPVLRVWKSQNVFFFKRTLGAGYAGVDNPTLFDDNAALFLGDAKATSDKLLAALQARI